MAGFLRYSVFFTEALKACLLFLPDIPVWILFSVPLLCSPSNSNRRPPSQLFSCPFYSFNLPMSWIFLRTFLMYYTTAKTSPAACRRDSKKGALPPCILRAWNWPVLGIRQSIYETAGNFYTSDNGKKSGKRKKAEFPAWKIRWKLRFGGFCCGLLFGHLR